MSALLWTYPRRYRRERGAEMLGTLAESGRRPTVREAVNLVLHGLRARVGRPASRSVVVWSLVFAAAVGVLGAAGGELVAWQVNGGPADDATVLATVPKATGEAADPHGVQHDGRLPFGHYGAKSWVDEVPLLVSPLGGEDFAPGKVEYFGTRPADIDYQEYTRAAQRRLAGAGWRVTPVTFTADGECNGPPCQQSDIANIGEFTARHGGMVLDLQVERGDPEAGQDGTGPAWDPVSHGKHIRTQVTFYRAEPAHLMAAAVGGGLVAAVLGWILFGWLNRRMDRRSRQVRSVHNFLSILVGVLLGVPAGFGLLMAGGVAAQGSGSAGLVPYGGLLQAVAYPGIWPELLAAVIVLVLIAVSVVAAREDDDLRS